MTKRDAIQAAKDGWSVDHPETGGYIVEKASYLDHETSRWLEFNGDCNPVNGWRAEYLGER